MTAKEYTPIPGPPGIPFVGNIWDVDPQTPLLSMDRLAETYGPIFKMTVLGKTRVIISSRDLLDEVCDEERFTKTITAGLSEVRNSSHDGLFTARYGEHNWHLAHRILVPAFGPLAIRDMFDDMYDIATQLAMKWARQGPKVSIEAADDFTRLTLDTLALSTMGTRFNSFYTEKTHPFVDAMAGVLQGSGIRARRSRLANSLPTSQNTQYWLDIDHMRKFAEGLLEERRQSPVDQRDILNVMINGRDPQTGEGLSDFSIVNNMMTFLVAGHETTSGALSFLMYYLLKTPRAYKKLQEEIDTVVGRNERLHIEHLAKLPYLNACIRESLRLHPTAPGFSLQVHPDKPHEGDITLGNGKYKIEKEDTIGVLLGKTMRDPAVYGPDPEEFKPERMLDENFEKLPRNSWKPFGNGMRGCIGRPFAWQEMLLVMAILMQNFNFSMADPNYDIRINQTLTIKPKEFYIRATLRPGLTASKLNNVLNGGGSLQDEKADSHHASKGSRPSSSSAQTPMGIYFGSNTGTCEALARRLAGDAVGYGYKAEVDGLDSIMENIPTDRPVIIVTASYDGKPPDNASHFYEWLTKLSGKELEGVNFAVFGCGHHDWTATFQKIPTDVDRLFGKHGGSRIVDRGFADAAVSDIFSDFDSWSENALGRISETFGGENNAQAKGPAINVQVKTEMRTEILGHRMQQGVVLETKQLTAPEMPVKQHIAFQLPEDMTYQAGDYLAILPTNPDVVVHRVLRRFDLPSDAIFQIEAKSGAASMLSVPLDMPIPAFDVLSSYVELSQPASKRDIIFLSNATGTSKEVKDELEQLINRDEVSAKRISILDLLVQYPTINISIGDYLAMLPPMRTRQYSISSSPLVKDSECTITFSVLSSPALSSQTVSREENYLGVASNYLANLSPGDRVHMVVKPSQNGFQPPADPSTPMIMACAGSGYAPFRSFIMDRVEKIKARNLSGTDNQACGEGALPNTILYIGCRSKGSDDIYAEELAEWQALGAVDVRWAYSRPDKQDGTKPAHVQDRIAEDKTELTQLFEKGSLMFICGSVGVGNAIKASLKKVYLEERRARLETGVWKGKPVQENEDEDVVADEWMHDLQAKQRFVADVFT
ncbi:Oxidoreductase FAD/NAD(P)-binding [Penicillium capsulatum]|uniref:Bifunctional cytochrome P450/NADPH--P450 reductase n=1 Tax=Penicillium capsulatum TaxID=69766 RepID=A0A9W9IRH9_9EURO|nr:Oxidoreductase FAD/NAD(P)-binding [Penicillium capsulatum]KAJ6129519.1 Oxidoreductase FAD/NAD(P)-binding [Penicillium capsulatum]